MRRIGGEARLTEAPAFEECLFYIRNKDDVPLSSRSSIHARKSRRGKVVC